MAFDWIKRRTATLTELQAQHESAASACSAAETSVQAAQAAFDDDGSDTCARALAKARESADLTREHLSRARRLLDEASAKAAAELRAQREARLAEVDAWLAGPGYSAARAAAIEAVATALRGAAKVYADSGAIEAEIRKHEHERMTLRVALGQSEADAVAGCVSSFGASLSGIVRALDKHAHSTDTLEGRFLHAVRRGLEGAH